MDPITIAILAATAIAAVGAVVSQVIRPLLSFTINQMHQTYRTLFEGREILILGDAQSGKTSLIQFIITGIPYVSENGVRKAPDRTSGVVFIDEFNEQGKQLTDRLNRQLGNLEKDVGGDDVYHDIWRELIEGLNPHGIIYMVNGSLDVLNLYAAMAPLHATILPCYVGGTRNLRALHVYVNFSDKIPANEREHKRVQVETLLNKTLASSTYNKLTPNKVKRRVILTQLSINANSWPEADQAITSFGKDLREVG